jgi:hypothetical protein
LHLGGRIQVPTDGHSRLSICYLHKWPTGGVRLGRLAAGRYSICFAAASSALFYKTFYLKKCKAVEQKLNKKCKMAEQKNVRWPSKSLQKTQDGGAEVKQKMQDGRAEKCKMVQQKLNKKYKIGEQKM